MKAFMELVNKFLDLFRPKRKYVAPPPQHGIIIEEFYGGPDSYAYSVGTGGSGGSDGKMVTVQGPAQDIGGPGTPNATRITVENALREAKEFSRLIDPAAHAVKKKRHKTKKATAAANTADILEILKWTTLLTATQLQQSSHIRRDRFLPLLKKLVKQGKIEKTGSGKRGNPFFYRLSKNA